MTGDAWDSGEAWSEARARARAEVQEALARRGEDPRDEERLDPGLSRQAKRRLLVAAAVSVLVIGVLAALLVPGIQHSKSRSAAEQKRKEQAAFATERRRIAADQRLHTAAAPGSHAALRRLPPDRLRAALVGGLETSIGADARARVAAHTLQGPILRTDCTPLAGFAGPPIGKYTCTAVNANILRGGGANVGALGYPFWAVIDFRRLSYVWCKVNPKAGEGSATSGAAVLDVPLPPRCDIGA
jgi:type II secretory pathway pseudopilin PulG